MTKKANGTCKSSLCCKATANLRSEVEKDLDKPDKSLGELLDEKENDCDDVCDSSDESNKR
jgi:hypothetical protein